MSESAPPESYDALTPPPGVVDIYTDGACQGNPGPGGWGALLRYARADGEVIEKPINGAEDGETTNNRMEILAAISALEHLKRRSVVRLFTDSTYVRDGITRWLPNWKRNGWQTKDKKPVKNVDLWQRLDELASGHDISWHWVKGHADNPFNHRVDELAVKAAEQARLAQ